MTVNDLMMLADDDIDYSSLSVETLKELALGDELFIATSALGELANRDRSLGAEVAKGILLESRGDRYLQSAALEILFQRNREQALDYMVRYAKECDRYILHTIMELIIENKDDFKSGIALSVSRLISE